MANPLGNTAWAAIPAAVLALATTPAHAQVDLTIELVTSGFSAPTYLTAPIGDAQRLFVVEQNSGLIRIIRNGQILPTPFLDVGALISGTGERGLLGMAFHPDYANNGRFFINYTQNVTGGPGALGDTVVAEYAVSASDPDVADPTLVQVILSVSQPFLNHNGGGMQFGPDGMLYIGMGDGGSGNDPGNRAQNTNQQLGKMLRLDVDVASPFLPPDNPFAGGGGDPAIWMRGLRNPWRFSFDRLTGDLWIGDVGQFDVEEIDFVAGGGVGGENFAWRCMEGNDCTGLTGCVCFDAVLTDPIHTYGHNTGGCSVTGGYVYRGSEIPALQGTYFFADFCSSEVWTLEESGGAAINFTDRTAELSGPIGLVSSFGEGGTGELYIIDYSDGEVHKIVELCHILKYCRATDNSSGGPASISATGSTMVADMDLSLLATDLPPNRFGYFLMSQVAGFIPLFGNSQGNLCLGSPLVRFAANGALSSPTGELALTLDFMNLPNLSVFSPGDQWHFQCWFRDVNPTNTSNTTDGGKVRFCP